MPNPAVEWRLGRGGVSERSFQMDATPATVARIIAAIPEGRLDHGLSQRQLAALSGVSATTIRKLERGGRINPALLVRLGTALVVLDAFRQPYFEHDVDALLQQAARDPWAS
jgi:transcriptional regulator with XRE-family HTH domain